MDIENVRNHCLKKKGVTEGFPFDDETLVFKVMGKMFCLASLTPPLFVNLKCDPEIAVELREKYDFVQPGYHMNKTNWNSVYLDGIIDSKLLYTLIDDSYNLIVAGLTKKLKEELKNYN